jgi:hypothetical protein
VIGALAVGFAAFQLITELVRAPDSERLADGFLPLN